MKYRMMKTAGKKQTQPIRKSFAERRVLLAWNQRLGLREFILCPHALS
jgi:hypothetical protein